MSVLRGNNGPRYKHNADDSASYDTITVDKLTPIIGAEIGGVDLSQPLGNQTFEEIHRALAENLVIFFRDQHISESSTWTSVAASESCTFIRRRRMHPVIPS
jgi:alpha-ketoglutarate-dependent taurine dioxygenase